MIGLETDLRPGGVQCSSQNCNSYRPGGTSAKRKISCKVTNQAAPKNDLAGNVTSLTNPSGRVITYAYDNAARALSAIDSSGPINYAFSASYAPQGSLAYFQNGASLKSTYIFNNRLQPCWMYSTTGTALPTSTACNGTAATATDLDLKYCFNSNMSDPDRAAHNCAASATLNNGNVAQVVNNGTTGRTQNFKYDELNRIQKAYTEATSGAYCWGETFGYDIWGNLLTIGPASGYSGCTQESGLSVTATTKNQISGDGYDLAGNLTTATGFSGLSYNAENQLATASGVTYTYDGDGKRVKKSNGKLYWYGAGSDALDETDLTGNLAYEFVFFGGKRIARRDSSNNVTYYFADHLGTARVVTNAGGTVLDDSDFYPFGGERPVLSSSGNNYKFTGKERDSESGLDNFGARYNSSNIGRFMSPDSSAYSSLANPQAWNLYAYTLNNPLRYTDPTGHAAECKTNADDCLKAAQAAAANKEAASRLYINTVKTQHSFLGIKWTTTKNFLGIQGDTKSFAALSGNASRLASMITDSRVFGVSVQSSYTSTYTHLADKIMFGGGETPLHGASMTNTPNQGKEPEVFIDPNDPEKGVDTDAERDHIPPANFGEKFAHEFLGHLWGEVIMGNKSGSAQNKQDSIDSENAVRATDPTRGQKTEHHD